MVAGRVYNSEQMPPYTLHACAHMMGFRSNSTKGGGCNEIVIHAQKDMATTVEHDQTNMVVREIRLTPSPQAGSTIQRRASC